MPRLYQYEQVKELPAQALKVSEYAAQRGCTVPYIYELHRNILAGNRLAEFKIVTFQGINFILTNN